LADICAVEEVSSNACGGISIADTDAGTCHGANLASGGCWKNDLVSGWTFSDASITREVETGITGGGDVIGRTFCGWKIADNSGS